LAISKISEALDIGQDLWPRLSVRAPKGRGAFRQSGPNIRLGALRISLVKRPRRVCSIVEASEFVKEFRVDQLDTSSRDCRIPHARWWPFGPRKLEGRGQRLLAASQSAIPGADLASHLALERWAVGLGHLGKLAVKRLVYRLPPPILRAGISIIVDSERSRHAHEHDK